MPAPILKGWRNRPHENCLPWAEYLTSISKGWFRSCGHIRYDGPFREQPPGPTGAVRRGHTKPVVSCDCRKGRLRVQTQRDTVARQNDAEALKHELVGLFQYIRRVRQEFGANGAAAKFLSRARLAVVRSRLRFQSFEQRRTEQ